MAMTVSRTGVITFADQLVSSATNFAVVVLAARALPASDFGVFSIGLVAVTLVVAGLRAYLHEPLLLGAVDPVLAVRSAIAAAATIVAIPAVIVGVVVGAVFADAALGAAVVLLTGTTGVQDACRYLAISTDRPHVALVSDAAWLVALTALMLAVEPDGPADVTALNVVAVAIAVVAARVLSVGRFAPGGVRDVVAAVTPLGRRLFVEQGIAVGSTQVGFLGAGAAAGARVAGGARAAVALMGPLNTVNQAAYLAFVRGLRRRLAAGAAALAEAIKVSAAMTLVAVAYVLVLFVLVGEVGDGLFGDTWAEVRDVRLQLGLSMVIGASMIGPYYVMRARQEGGTLVRFRVVTAPVSAVVPPLGALWWGLSGFFWGFVASVVVQVVVVWVLFGRAAPSAQGVPTSTTVPTVPVLP